MTLTRDYYVEEVEFMLGCGEPPRRIAERLGLRANSLARAMYRASRPDLARIFGRLDRRNHREARTRQCACGAAISRRAVRCVPCAAAHRWGRAA